MAKGKPYNKEFRDNAVRLSMMPGKTAAQVAHELGISIYTLHEWRRNARQATSTAVRTSADEPESLEQQNRRLARELALAREEAAILKKAIAYFAQPPKK